MANRQLDRRTFVTGAAAAGISVAAMSPSAETAHERSSTGFKGVAFDAFVLIDSRPIAASLEQAFPGQSARVLDSWRTKQFEYAWLRTLGVQYQDFWATTRDALAFAARSLALSLDPATRDRIMHAYLELQFWPDARETLVVLKRAGIRAAFLSNFTAGMLDAAIVNSQMQGMLGRHLSTDRVNAFKPHPRAYEMALHAFGAHKNEIVMCAAAGWDAAGAKWFGYPTVWVNRTRTAAEVLSAQADATVDDLGGLLRFMGLPRDEGVQPLGRQAELREVK